MPEASDEGALDRLISSVCLGGVPEGQLRRRSVARRSQYGNGEQTHVGGTRRSLPAMGSDHPVSNWTWEWLAEERRLPPYPWSFYSVYLLGSNPNIIPPHLRVWPINAQSARVRNGLNFSGQINGHLILTFPSPHFPVPSLIPSR